jgi:hypothetical protein
MRKHLLAMLAASIVLVLPLAGRASTARAADRGGYRVVDLGSLGGS